jgi:hypothetical protein
MHSLPQERPEEEALCTSLLRMVQDNRKIEQLREELSGFSHRCRNLLNGMKTCLYLVRRGAAGPLPPLWANIEHGYGGIEQLLDRIQAIYRPIPLTLVHAPFGSLVQDHESLWRDQFRASGRTLEIKPPDKESSCDFDPMHLGEGFDAFLSWRAAVVRPGQVARLSWRTSKAHLEVEWHESAIDAQSACSLQAEQCPGSSLSLGLPLLARVIRAHRGVMRYSPVPRLSVLCTCPLEQPKTEMEPAS